MKKIIHYCWFGGKKLPKDVLKCIKTWKKYLPDYEIKEWNESNFDVNSHPFVKGAYENKKWAFVSDYVRIYALYNEGGIYFDTDLKVIKNPGKILETDDMFLGYEDSGYVGTAVIGGAEPHNAFIKEILDYYDKIDKFNPDIVYNYANPVVISKLLKNYKKETRKEDGVDIFENNVHVYPRDYFFPISFDYTEKVFTENTCTVHLFNATWTDKRDKRMTTLNRKLGPRFGRYLNNFLDGLVKIRIKIVHSIMTVIRSFKFKYSIHFKINKRLEDINNQLEKIDDDFIIITHPDYDKDKLISKGLYANNILYLREQHTDKEMYKIAHAINNHGKTTVILNSFYEGWNRLAYIIKDVNSDIKIKAILRSDSDQVQVDYEWKLYENIVKNMYIKRIIDEIGVFDNYLYDFLKDKNYNVSLLKQAIIDKEDKSERKLDRNEIKVGIYYKNVDAANNIYNQIAAAALLDNVRIDCSQITYQISVLAQTYNLNINGNTSKVQEESIISYLKDNDINLLVRYVNDNQIFALESLEYGVPCLIYENSSLKGSKLESMIKVNNPNDIYEIKNKILEVVDNKDKIIEEYKEFKKEYNKEVETLKNNFIK